MFKFIQGKFQPTPFTVGIWHLDHSSADSSGNGNNGTDTNISYVQRGLFGYSSFGTGSSNISIADNASQRGMAQLTISAWVNISDFSGFPGVIGKWMSGNCYFLRFTSAGLLHIYIRNSVGVSSLTDTWNGLDTNVWTHVGATYDGRYLLLYRNGHPIDLIDLGGNQGAINNSSTGNLFLCSQYDGTAGIPGYVSEVIMEKRAWLPNEMGDYYARSHNLFSTARFLAGLTIITDTVVLPCGPVGNIEAIVGSSSIAVTMDAVENAAQYILERNNEDGQGWNQIYEGSSPSYTDPVLPYNVALQYRYKAVNGPYDTGWSGTLILPGPGWTTWQRFLKYLPNWVKLTDAMNALTMAGVNAIQAAYTYLKTIQTMFTQGKGLRLAAKDWGLFLSGNETDAEIVAMMEDRFEILQARGTSSGILSDIRTLTGDTTATVDVDPDRGWIMDVVYPDDEYCYADLDTVHVVTPSYTNKSQRSEDEIEAIIRKSIVPLNVSILNEE